MIQVIEKSSRMRMIIASPKPYPPGQRLPVLGQLVGKDRDKDDVVYAQHDLKCRQGEQRYPDLWVS
jgi:hypothetical protein